RQNRNKSLRLTSEGITSKSSLDRWERGQDNLSFNQVLQLIKKLHIRPIELINNGLAKEIVQDIREVEDAYLENNTDFLLRICQLQDHVILSGRDFWKVALACNCYMELTGKNIFTQTNRKRLKNYFLKIEDWYYEDFMNFGNTALLLDSSDIFRISAQIVNYVKFAELQDNENYQIVYNTLINAVYILIRGNTDLAKRLLSYFSSDLIPQKYAFERIRYYFMTLLLDYCESRDDSKIKVELDFLKMNNLDLLHEVCEYSFQQVKAGQKS
ncbi:hypothetical protein, partial [Lactobacillus pasteurii]|uniref:Rgg family transcriptional regulator n=1 Tax=Lactobacillus pasteurii TaxID=872327 RepID=UPI000A77FBB7